MMVKHRVVAKNKKQLTTVLAKTPYHQQVISQIAQNLSPFLLRKCYFKSAMVSANIFSNPFL